MFRGCPGVVVPCTVKPRLPIPPVQPPAFGFSYFLCGGVAVVQGRTSSTLSGDVQKSLVCLCVGQ